MAKKKEQTHVTGAYRVLVLVWSVGQERYYQQGEEIQFENADKADIDRLVEKGIIEPAPQPEPQPAAEE